MPQTDFSTALSDVNYGLKQARLQLSKDTPDCHSRRPSGISVPDNWRDLIALEKGLFEFLKFFEELDSLSTAFKDRFDCNMAASIGDQLKDGFEATLHDSCIGAALTEVREMLDGGEEVPEEAYTGGFASSESATVQIPQLGKIS